MPFLCASSSSSSSSSSPSSSSSSDPRLHQRDHRMHLHCGIVLNQPCKRKMEESLLSSCAFVRRNPHSSPCVCITLPFLIKTNIAVYRCNSCASIIWDGNSQCPRMSTPSLAYFRAETSCSPSELSEHHYNFFLPINTT